MAGGNCGGLLVAVGLAVAAAAGAGAVVVPFGLLAGYTLSVILENV